MKILAQTPQATQAPSGLPLYDTTGDNLYADGYRAYVRDEYTLFVRKPDGTRYILNPYRQTCSCPASKRCKHLSGLTDLVFLSMDALFIAGKGESAMQLTDFWNDYTVWYRRAGR